MPSYSSHDSVRAAPEPSTPSSTALTTTANGTSGRNQQFYAPQAYILRGGEEVVPLHSTRTSVGRTWYSELTAYGYSDLHLANAYSAGVTAWAAQNVRATHLAQLPIIAADMDRNPLERSPLDTFIRKSIQFLWWIETSLLIWGKFYLRKVRNRHGFPSQLEWINPLDITYRTIYRNGKHEIIAFRIFGRAEEVALHDMIFGHLFNPLIPHDGISPFEMVMHQINAEFNLIRYAESFFVNSTRPDGILSFSGGVVSEAEVDKVEQDMKELRGSKNAFKTLIVTAQNAVGEWRWEPMTVAPTDLAMDTFRGIIREEILAAFSVDPVMVGMATAADPLSANNTYREIFSKHTEFTSLPRLRFILGILNDQWVSKDFHLLDAPIQLIPDRAEIDSVLYATSDRSQLARDNAGSGLWTYNEGREHTGKQPIEIVVKRDPTNAIEAFQAGLIKRSQAQIDIGAPADTVIDGYIYDLDPSYTMNEPPIFGSLNFQQPPQPPAPSPLPTLPSPPPAIAPATPMPIPVLPAAITPLGEREEPAAPERSVELSVTLSLANNPDLIGLQRTLMQRGLDGIRWIDADKFHVTVLHIPITTMSDIRQFVDAATTYLDKPPALSLGVGSLASFDKIGEHAIHFRIKKNSGLLELQESLYRVALDVGMVPSSYTMPSGYKPHITIGYAPSKVKLIPFEAKFKVQPTALDVSRQDEPGGDWTTLKQVDMTGHLAARAKRTDNVVSELNAWLKRVKHHGADAAFTTVHVPDYLSAYVQSELKEFWNPTEVFRNARDWIRAGEPPEPIGATPEQYDAYWRNFDDLEHDIGKRWLNYQQAVSDDLLKQAIGAFEDGDAASFAVETDTLGNATATHELIDAWVGTQDDPAVLSQLLLAGAASGQQALERETVARPRVDSKVDLKIDWDLFSHDAVDFVRSYGFNLIRGINQTTVEKIRRAITKAIEEGWSLPRLEQQMTLILVTTSTPTGNLLNRANSISQSESIRAFNEGAFERWERADVMESIWQTVRDTHVCPICRPLHGKRAKFRDGWVATILRKSGTIKKIVTSLAHPRCRCFRRPGL